MLFGLVIDLRICMGMIRSPHRRDDAPGLLHSCKQSKAVQSEDIGIAGNWDCSQDSQAPDVFNTDISVLLC